MKVYPWQEVQWQRLQTTIAQQRLPHALLLEGPPGIGLTHFSTAFAAGLLCEQPRQGYACGKCRSCLLLDAGSHPDFQRIQPAKDKTQISVELVRELIAFLQLKSQYGRYKVAVIEPADLMNASSANALLKTLEEPPPTSLMLLNTHTPGRLPITIRSRCQRLAFKPQLDEASRSWLADRLQPDMDPALLLNLAGAPLAALDLVENDQVAVRDRILEDLAAIRGAAFDPVAIGQAWQGIGAGDVIMWLQRLFMDMVQLKISEHPPGLRNPDQAQRLRRFANGLDLGQLVSCCQLLARISAQHASTVSYNAQAMLEEFALFWHDIETSGGMNP